MNVQMPGTVHVDISSTRARLQARLAILETRLAAEGDDGAWREYVAALDLWLKLEDRLASQEGDGRAVMTTKELAQRLGVSVKTVLARKAKGHIRPSVSHGKALGWSWQDVLR